MTRSSSPSIAPERRRAATGVGVLVAIGLGLSVQSATAQGVSPLPAAPADVVTASSSMVPALPPTDPRYILARLQSEYLIEIAKDWYRVDIALAGSDRGPSPAP